jgi:hypothetical protein
MGVTAKPFTVGSSSDGSDRFLGAIDEVYVCRGAMSAADLIDLMNGLPPVSPSPIPGPSLATANEPTLMELSVTADSAIVTWTAVPGQIYRVQYKDNLDDVEWQDLTGDIYAYDPVVRIEDFLDGQPQRFYRVVRQP